jgi:hypothetical protein
MSEQTKIEGVARSGENLSVASLLPRGTDVTAFQRSGRRWERIE